MLAKFRRWFQAASFAELFFLAFGLTVLIMLGVSAARADAQVPSITLRWTAVGDDSLVGTATSYDLRWQTYAPSQVSLASWWATANRVSGMPAPKPSGSPEVATVAPNGGWAAGRTYFFVIKVKDEAGNVSDWSNTAAVPVLDRERPARITDIEKGN